MAKIKFLILGGAVIITGFGAFSPGSLHSLLGLAEVTIGDIGDKENIGDMSPISIMSPNTSPVSLKSPIVTENVAREGHKEEQKEKKTKVSISNIVSPSLLPSVSVTPSSIVTPTPYRTSLMTPRLPVTPTPVPTLSPTPLPQLSPSPSQTPVVIPSPSPSSTPPAILDSLSVVIHEVGWMGTGDSATDEWIELRNNTAEAIDLSQWQLISKTDGSPTISFASCASVFISAHGYYLIERTSDTTISNIVADCVSSFGSGGLKNIAEHLVLVDHDSQVQDEIAPTDSAWFAGSNGNTENPKASMERRNPLQSGSSVGNWATFGGGPSGALDAGGNPVGGTPRAGNSGQ